MKGRHKTISIYPETHDKLVKENKITKLSKIVIIDNAIEFYLKYKEHESILKNLHISIET